MVVPSVLASLGNIQEPGRMLKPKLKRRCKRVEVSEHPPNANISSSFPAKRVDSSRSCDVGGVTATLAASTINLSEPVEGTNGHEGGADIVRQAEHGQQAADRTVQGEKGKCSKTRVRQTKAAGGRKKSTSAKRSCSKKAAYSRKKRGPARKPFNKSSIHKGVSHYGRTKRWEAQIWMSRCGQIYLGAFSSELKAGRAYDRAVIHFKADGAYTNFPVQDYQAEIAQLRTISSDELVKMLRRQSAGEGLEEPEYPAELNHLRVDVNAVGSPSSNAEVEINREIHNAADQPAEMDSAPMATHAEPATVETCALSLLVNNNPPVRMSIDINVMPVDSETDTQADRDHEPVEIVQQGEPVEIVHKDDPVGIDYPFSVLPWKPLGLRHDENVVKYNELMYHVLHPGEPYFYHFI